MIALYCSNKLHKYIGFKENQVKQGALCELNSWNGHLFIVNRKKSLFFMNHETYFSFICYDIKKPDIKKLDQLFITGFIKELNKLSPINTEQETQLKTYFSGVFLHSSINNRKVIGSMSNLIQMLDYVNYEYENMQDYFNHETLNETPLKQIDYFYPKDAMKEKVNQLFKGELRIVK